MEPTPLTHVWQYTDVDRAFWAEHLEDWVPARVFDAHVHINDPSLHHQPVTDEQRRQMWVAEVAEPTSADAIAACDAIVYPGREVTHLAFGWPALHFDLEETNAYVHAECAKRGWASLALLRPQWSADQVAAALDAPGVIGVKPYYALIGHDPTTRDRYIESSIYDFLPHSHLEVLNDRQAWVTLHVPKADRLGHADNLREVRDIRDRYPNVIIVLAHFGRCYTEPHAAEALPHLADDAGLYWDNSAVLNPAIHRMALELVGPERIIYGTDNPVFFMRGRRQWDGRRYINCTSAEFYFNAGQHEPPEVEAGYTLYMYEALKACKDACEAMGLGSNAVEAMFWGNAERLARQASQ